MNLLRLFRKPRAAIRAKLSAEPDWLLALTGYAMLAFSSGFERTHARMTDIPSLFSVLVMLAIAAVVSWIWAWVWGGLFHMGARIVGGQSRVRDTVLAVGYSLVFPGIALVVGIIGAVLGGEESGVVVGAGCGLFLAGYGWSAYNTILAIRVCHDLSWARSAGAWLLTTIFYGGVIFGLVALLTYGLS